MSPQQDLLAVLTSHTVHICILPDSSHLTTRDTGPFKAKFWTLGPTTHVTSRSAIVSALWHPLGVNGSCLITVTEDAVVRVWELSLTNRWSFDTPTYSIDLKKLADGTELEQDYSASTSATNKVFSPDSFDMQVAAACFPGRGSGGWSPMTLWVAMTGGDLYALCPLLPEHWAPPPTLIPSLSVSIVAKAAAMEDDPGIPPHSRLLAQQQLEWMSELDAQEPRILEGALGEPETEVYQRPSRPGIIPRLQGPFVIESDPEDEQDDEIALSDILVMGQRVNTTDLMMGEDEDEDLDLGDDDQGLSVSVLCLLSRSGQVKICLDLDGVEAKWLPPRSKGRHTSITLPQEQPSLLAFQTFDTLKPAELRDDYWPVISEDITSRYAFYVTHAAGITHVSLASWVFRLESELQNESEAGAAFRLDLLVKGPGSGRERIYTQRPEQGPLAAAVAMHDPDLGFFVLSATPRDPVALFFEMPEEDRGPTCASSPEGFLSSGARVDAPRPADAWEPRPLFHPAAAFDRENGVYAWLQHLRSGKRMPLLKQEVRLSPATLEVFSDGHRLVSSEIFHLNQAVAELFTKCESLETEMREQITKANEMMRRVESVTGDDGVGEEAVSDKRKIARRAEAVQRRQDSLTHRIEALKKRLGRATTRELSDKEKAWADEVQAMQQAILGPGSAAAGDQDGLSRASSSSTSSTSPPKTTKPLWQRLEEVQGLWSSLQPEAEKLIRKEVSEEMTGREGPASPVGSWKIPSDLRKARVAQVKSLLDRETALVEAVRQRLERLAKP